mmetsp:Transcript_28352/g.39423  ORF Transcript_28352/g.39423 Transcript_28352/m.39423 type:complete len:536 (-) Transcript_28352:274-1881(-)
MKKAMELSVLCGCEVGLILNFDAKLFVYASNDIDEIIRKYHDFEGTYEQLSNQDRESLQPGRASTFKLHAQRQKSRKAPCRNCGCHNHNCSRPAQAYGGYQNISAPSSDFQFAAANATRMNGGFNMQQNAYVQQLQGYPASKRQRLGHNDTTDSRVDVKNNQFQQGRRNMQSTTTLQQAHQQQPRLNTGSARRGGRSGSLLHKRKAFNSTIGPVVIPQKPNIEQFSAGTGLTPASGLTPLSNQQGNNAGSGNMGIFTPQAGESRHEGLPTGGSIVPPSPSSFFNTDSQQNSTQAVSFSGTIPSLSPFGWGTPTNPNGRTQTFNKIPGHPDASAAAIADSGTTGASGTSVAVNTMTASSATGGTLASNSGDVNKAMLSPNSRKPLSLRRGLTVLSSLNISSLAKPKPKVVEVSTSESANAPSSVIGSQKNPFDTPTVRNGRPSIDTKNDAGVHPLPSVAFPTPPSRGGNILTPSFANLMGFPSPMRSAEILASPKMKAPGSALCENNTKTEESQKQDMEPEGLHAITQAMSQTEAR